MPSVPTMSTVPSVTAAAPSLAPSSTTTSVPSSPTPMAPGSLQYSGVLSYPEDIATSIPFTSPSGVAAVRVTWHGGSELVAALRCRGAHDSVPGTHGISISIDGSPGACAVAIALASGVRSHVAYAVSVLTPDAGG